MDFPNAYYPNATNVWDIEADNDTKIVVDFTFVEVKDIPRFFNNHLRFNSNLVLMLWFVLVQCQSRLLVCE